VVLHQNTLGPLGVNIETTLLLFFFFVTKGVYSNLRSKVHSEPGTFGPTKIRIQLTKI
jgi:hypothetical protein